MVFGIATGAAAQTRGAGVGIKGGPIFNDLSSAREDFKGNTGLQGGIFFGGNRGGVLGVMGEVLYAKKGADLVDLHYLEIPILLRLNAGSRSLNGISFYGIAGPVLDVKLKTTIDGASNDSEFGNFDAGVIAGAGIEITRFLIEGRYNWGLRNIAKGDLGSVTEIKNRSFAVLFGFRFN